MGLGTLLTINFPSSPPSVRARRGKLIVKSVPEPRRPWHAVDLPVRPLRVLLLAAAVSLAGAGCVAEPCLCDDEDLNPHRPGRDGRASASLGADEVPPESPTACGGVAVATPVEKSP